MAGYRGWIGFQNITSCPGSVIDAEGCLWNAEFGGGRYSPFNVLFMIIAIEKIPRISSVSCKFIAALLESWLLTNIFYCSTMMTIITNVDLPLGMKQCIVLALAPP